jgi:hypothetical protein
VIYLTRSKIDLEKVDPDEALEADGARQPLPAEA